MLRVCLGGRFHRRAASQTSDRDALDDAALVAAARSDPHAFSALYERYAEPIYRYCAFRLGGPESAEDATEEIFLKALAGLHAFRGGSFAAWLFQIAHNVVINHYRRRQPTLPLEVAAELPDQAPGLDDIASRRAAWGAVQDALASLPGDQRSAVELGIAGWSGEEIAAVLGKSPAAVKTLRYRALQRLRAILAEQGVKEAQHDPV